MGTGGKSASTKGNGFAAIASGVVAIAWAVLIFWMSSRTSGQMHEGIFAELGDAVNKFVAGILLHEGDFVSVIGHFCEYLVFGALLANALYRGVADRLPWAAIFAIALAIASAYGVTDEIHQLFVDGRWCTVDDWVVDTVGAAIGAGVFSLVGRLRFAPEHTV